MLLALDTSTSYAGVALHGPEGPVAWNSWRSGRMHTVQLLPAVDVLLERAGVSREELTAIGVAIGPGSFTGVRVALATAKGIAAVLGIPLLGIDTLLFTAWPHRYAGLPVRACLPLGRGRLAVAAYTPDGAGLSHEWTRNLLPEQALESVRVLYCGELDTHTRVLVAANDPKAVMPLPSVAMRNPAVLAELAWERLLQGEADPPASLQAVYLGTT